MAKGGQVARVLLDTSLPQLDHLFEYRIPERLAENLETGMKVSVPLRGGTRYNDALVVDIVDKPDFPGELQEIHQVISTLPILSKESFELAESVARRQAGSINDVLRLVIPPRYVRAEKAYAVTRESVLGRKNSGIAPKLSGRYSTWDIKASKRWAVDIYPELVPDVHGHSVPGWTDLLCQLATQTIAAGKSAIIAVPDFRDIENMYSALCAAGLEDITLRVDANQSGQQRYTNYLRSLEPQPVILIGNRSATLSPAHNLGLIALWDDGDENFIEPLAPYAHSRDVALIRQKNEDCTLVLAAHSRSIATQRLVDIQYLEVFRPDGPWPIICPTDEDLASEEDYAARIPAKALLAAKEASKYGPILVQVASPGFATSFACSRCGDRARCVVCFGPLGSKTRVSVASCRWCGHMATKWSCPDCQNDGLKVTSAGTEKTAEEIGRAFPGLKVIVSDGQNRHLKVDDAPAVIIATVGAEPIPLRGYSAVLLIDGNRLRARESLNVNEDVLRGWSNAVALARHGAPIFLTGSGENLGRTMATWSQDEFMRRELLERASLRLPPVTRVVSVTGALKLVTDTCESVSTFPGVRILGPLGTSNGAGRALITFDYKEGEALAKHLRSCVVASATRTTKPLRRGESSPRVLRLRVRFDDPQIDSLD